MKVKHAQKTKHLRELAHLHRRQQLGQVAHEVGERANQHVGESVGEHLINQVLHVRRKLTADSARQERDAQ